MEFQEIQQITPGQYHRLHDNVTNWDQSDITQDRMYLVIELRHRTVSFMGIFPEEEKEYNQSRNWTSSEDEFFNDFEFSQEASDQRQKILDEIVGSAHTPIEKEFDEYLVERMKTLHTSDQALFEAPQSARTASIDPTPSDSTELATTPQETAALAQRDKIAEVRYLIQKRRADVVARNKRMQLAMLEKTALMQYMVHAMNVYLGVGEELAWK